MVKGTYYKCFCFLIFYWSIVDLQCCISIRCTAKCISYSIYIYIYIYSLDLLFLRSFSHIGHYRVLGGSLCYTTVSYKLTFLYILVCISVPITQFTSFTHTNVLLCCVQSSYFTIFSSVQSLSHVWLFATPWTTARQASLSITNSWGLFKLMSIESVMPSDRLNFCHPLLLLPLIFPSIRVFSNESALHIRQPKYWSFSFRISPYNKYLGLIREY